MTDEGFRDFMAASPYSGQSREKLTAGINHDLVELPDEALVLIRGLVAEVLQAERARGTARRIGVRP